MAKPRTKKSSGNGSTRKREDDDLFSMRMTPQEKDWLERLSEKHREEHGLMKPNSSAVVRSWLRKAAAAAGLPGA